MPPISSMLVGISVLAGFAIAPWIFAWIIWRRIKGK